MKDESDCPGNVPVWWNGVLYVTGNRYHEDVELYTVRGGNFVKTVRIDQLRSAHDQPQRRSFLSDFQYRLLWTIGICFIFLVLMSGAVGGCYLVMNSENIKIKNGYEQTVHPGTNVPIWTKPGDEEKKRSAE